MLNAYETSGNSMFVMLSQRHGIEHEKIRLGDLKFQRDQCSNPPSSTHVAVEQHQGHPPPVLH